MLAAPCLAASASDWQKRTIYQVMTDRFATSDGSGPTCNTDDKKYCGGTWKGITNHLDYIQNMGFDAIWISPIVANVQGTTAYGEAFHGYWPVDIFDINSHYGTADDLKSLSSALHKRSMYLMLDVVVNHLVSNSNPPQFTTDFKPFNAQSDFHPECFITDYNNQTNVEQCWLGDEKLVLADVNTEDSTIVTTLNGWIKDLVGNYSADGIRIDTVKHVRKDFWPDFASSAGVFTIGEVLSNETSYTKDYTQVLDSVLDYPTWYPLVAGFQTTNGDLTKLANSVQLTQSAYKNGAFGSGSFLDNHDQPRFAGLVANADSALIKNAMAFPFIHDGIPIVYQGQEQGYTGGADPANREALWLSGYVEDKDYVNHIKALSAARKAAASANDKFYSTKMTFPTNTTTSLAISKSPMLALLTNVGSKAATTSWSVSDTGYAGNTELVDVLSCATVTTDSSGKVTASSQNGQPMVFIPKSALSKSAGVCSSVATGAASLGRGVSYSLVAGIALSWAFLF